MIRVAYLSKVTRSNASLLTLSQITGVSSWNNRRDGLTGVLLCGAAEFLWILEGESSSIKRTVGRILSDPRHSDIQCLTREVISERSFPEWTVLAPQLDPSITPRVDWAIKDCSLRSALALETITALVSRGS